MSKSRKVEKFSSSISQIAQLSGVSRAVVSSILTGGSKTSRYSRVTEQRVRKIADMLHYRPGIASRLLKEGRTHIIGCAIPLLVEAYLMEMLASCIRAAYKYKYEILVTISELTSKDYEETLSRLLDCSADGLIIFPNKTFRDSSIYNELLETHRKAVLVEHDIYTDKFDFVGMDDITNYRMIIKHLTNYGHRNIGFIYEKEDVIPSAHQRRIEFEEVVSEFNLPILPRVYLQADTEPSDESDIIIDKIIKGMQTEGIRAIVIRGHTRTMWIYQKLIERDIKVPDELSIVNITAHRYNTDRVAFDSVNTRMDLVGEYAVELLVDRINNPDTPKKHIKIPGELISVGSVKRLG